MPFRLSLGLFHAELQNMFFPAEILNGACHSKPKTNAMSVSMFFFNLILHYASFCFLVHPIIPLTSEALNPKP